MSKRLLTAGGIAVLLLLLFSINILANAALRGVRLDLTEDSLYTLSPGTKDLLGNLEEPITLRLYFSEKLARDYPPIPSYAQRVEELLSEYAAHSGGVLTLEVLDPEPFTEVEDRAVQLGLQGIPVGTGEQLYFGLAGTNSLGDVEVIPFFHPDKESFLEYDLTNLVYRLSGERKRVVGVLSSLPIEGGMPDPMQREMPQPWFVLDQIRQLFETRTILPSAREIPDEVGVLMVVHPKDLPEDALYAIDQFVMRGGKVVLFVDPFSEVDQPPADPQNPMAAMMAPRASNMPSLLDAWGVELVPEKIAADLENALQITATGRSGRREPVQYVVYLALSGEDLNQEEVVTRDLRLPIHVATAGILQPKQGATTEFVPLLVTSEQSMQVNTSQVQFGANPQSLLADFFPIGQEMVLAARLGGPAKSAFPGGRPGGDEQGTDGEDEEDEESGRPHLAESQAPIHVIVFADTDMLSDRMWVQVQNFGGMRMGFKTAGNGDLVTNALDFLSGSTELIGLRSRGRSQRPFKVVEELQREAEQAYRAEEERLIGELEAAERRLNDLLAKQEGGGALILGPEEQAEIDRLRDEQVKTRKRLREVRRDLRRDIEGLGTSLKWINIGLIPLLVGLFAVALGAWRVQRRQPSS